MNDLKRTRDALNYFAKGANKSNLSEAEKKRLSSIKASFRNAKDDGYVGGESGVSINHFKNSADWLEKIIDKYQLELPIHSRTSWPMVRISPENHSQLTKSQAKESAKRGRVISLVDWCNEVIEAGLRAFRHIK
jgi:hypothetical protein